MDNETSRDKILELVFKKPTTRFHVREIARLTGLNPNPVAKIAGNLRKEKLVQIEKKKHVVEIYANAVDESFIKKKRVFNFMKVYESGIVDFLVKIFDPVSVSLMGSFSRGEDVERSDIDIVVVSSKKNERADLEKFEEYFGRNIHLLVIDYKEMSEEFYINFINGFVLYGHISKMEGK